MKLILVIALLVSVASAHGQVTCMSCDCNPALCEPVKPPPPTDTGKVKKPKKSTTTTSTVRGKGTVN
jgi:hypothetical protein